METTKSAQFIKGYWRGKDQNEVPQTKDPEKDNALIGAGLLLATIVVTLIIFWQVTLIIGATGAIGFGAHKYIQHKNSQDTIVINHY